MPETNDGENTEPKTFTQAEVDAIREEGRASGQKESHSHFQSVFDKEISKIKNENAEDTGKLTTSIRDLRAANLSALPEGERNSAMIREMYEDYLKPAPVLGVFDKPEVQGSPVQGASQQDLQAAINSSLKDLGLDTEKIDWGQGNNPAESMKTFLGSVVNQAREKAKSSAQADDPEKDVKPKGDPIDISRGTGDTTDYLKRDPQSLVSQDEWKPIHGMEQ